MISVKELTAGRVLVLIQVASLRSARQAHTLLKNKTAEIRKIESQTGASFALSRLRNLCTNRQHYFSICESRINMADYDF